MKKGLSILLILLLSFSITGCGLVPSLYSMTDEEEEQIVAYASKVVSKYNNLQGDGMTRVYASDYDDEEEEDSAEDDSSETDVATDVSEDTSTTDTETTNSVTLEAALEQPGITIVYQGVTVSSSYVEGDYLSLTPDDGYDYLILQFQLTNTGSETTAIDILSKHPSFTVTVDGSTTAKNEQTILLYDLATFQSDLAAGETQDAVLLFQVPSGSASSSSVVALQAKVGDATYDISL